MRKRVKVIRTVSPTFHKRLRIIFIIVCLVTLGPQVWRLWQLHQEIKTLEAQAAALKKQQQEYKSQIKGLQSYAVIEKLARERLGMIKPGEKILVEVEPQNNDNQ